MNRISAALLLPILWLGTANAQSQGCPFRILVPPGASCVAGVNGVPQLTVSPAAPSDTLRSEIIDTGVFPCDDTIRTLTWTNSTGRTLAIKSEREWHGYQYGTNNTIGIDAGSQLREDKNDTIIGEASTDHYANCQDNNCTYDTTEATQITVLPGMTLSLTYYCNDFLGSGKEAQFYSQIAYQVLKR